SEPAGLPAVPAAAVHLSGVRDRVLDVPPARAAGTLAGIAGWHSPALPDLSAADAVVGGRRRGQAPDAAQFNDLALLVVAVHARRAAGDAVLGQHRVARHADRRVRFRLHVALLANRAFQVAALAARACPRAPSGGRGPGSGIIPTQ